MSLRERLNGLDRHLLRRTYGDGWLFAVAVVGFVLCVLVVVGLLYGSHNRLVGDVATGPVVLLVLPLVELWRRRQISRGRRSFRRLQSLDDRVGASRFGRFLPKLRQEARRR